MYVVAVFVALFQGSLQFLACFGAWGSALALLQLAKGSQDLFPTSGPSLWNMLAEKFGNTQPVRFFKTVAERKEERGKFRTYLGKLYPQIP